MQCDDKLNVDVTLNDNGVIILYSGKQITLTGGSLPLGNNVRMVLMDDGGEFAAGDTLVSCLSGTITGDISTLEFIIDDKLQDGYTVEISDDRKSITLARVFDRATADVRVQGVGVEAGATIRLGEKWSANANYSFNAMDASNEHVLNIGASRTF